MTERLAVLVTVFNRRDKTLLGLRTLTQAVACAGVQADLFVVDDGSTDGTAAAVQREFPPATVVRHPGGLFWCRGMHLAWTRAQQSDSHSHYVWLNDDTLLAPTALERVLAVARQLEAAGRPGIVVGAARSATTASLSYSGMRRLSRWRPTHMIMVEPNDVVQACDAMNGNFVVVAAGVVERIGIIDPDFEHGMGDFDYGLRATRAGIPVVLCPGTVATCDRNDQTATFKDRNSPLRRRWRHMMSPKGLPWRSWLTFTRRHAGPGWLLFFLWPYLRVVASALVRPLATRRPTDKADA